MLANIFCHNELIFPNPWIAALLPMIFVKVCRLYVWNASFTPWKDSRVKNDTIVPIRSSPPQKYYVSSLQETNRTTQSPQNRLLIIPKFDASMSLKNNTIALLISFLNLSLIVRHGPGIVSGAIFSSSDLIGAFKFIYFTSRSLICFSSETSNNVMLFVLRECPSCPSMWIFSRYSSRAMRNIRFLCNIQQLPGNSLASLW